MTKEYQNLKTAILNVTHPFDGERIRPFPNSPLDNPLNSEAHQPNERRLRDEEEMLRRKLEGTYTDQDFVEVMNRLHREGDY